jgi:hypothetical protein
MVGNDPRDLITADADAQRADYVEALSTDALRGARIGVVRQLTGYHPGCRRALRSRPAGFARCRRGAGRRLVLPDARRGQHA